MSLSLNFREAAWAQETGDFPICLITVDHPDLDDPVRISTDNTQRIIETDLEIVYGTVFNGHQYLFCPCELTLPSDTPDGPGQLKLTIDNVHRDLVAMIRSIEGRPAMDVDMVMSNALDTVERSWPQFEIEAIPWDAGKIDFVASVETLTAEPYPAGTYTPAFFPGLFGGP